MPGPDPKPVRRRKQKRRPIDALTRVLFKETVLAGVRVCVVCRTRDCGPLQAHHVLYQQWIRGSSYQWDPRIGMAVGERCHARHHSRHAPICRALIPPVVWDIARELGIVHRLERAYPQ